MTKCGTRRLRQLPPHPWLQSVHVGDSWLVVEELRELAATVSRDFAELREIAGSSRTLDARELLARLPASSAVDGAVGPTLLQLSRPND